MSVCYNLIACSSTYPDILGITDSILTSHIDELISINGDTTKKYYVRQTHQLVVAGIENIAPICNIATILPLTWEIASIIYNGVEKVTSTQTYNLTSSNLLPINCTGTTCVPTTCPTANNQDNLAIFLNSVFTLFNIPLTATSSGVPQTYFGHGGIIINANLGDSFAINITRTLGPLSPFQYVYGIDVAQNPIYTLEGGQSSYVAVTPDNCVGSNLGITSVTIETICAIPLNCGCPPGSVLNQAGECIGVVLTAPVINNKVYTACKGDMRIGIYPNPNTYIPPTSYPLQVYGLTGASFYEDISSKPFPIIALPVPIPGNTPVWPFYQVTPLRDAALNPILVTNVIQNDVWGKTIGTDLINSPKYRLNKVGIWTCEPPINYQWQPIGEWIGFTFCETILTTKTYYIGIAADDSYKLYMNGTLIVDHSGTGYAFTSWKIIPITLTAGPVIFEARVINNVSSATLGFEIYDATLAELLGINQDISAGPANDINTYIIFSTLNKIGQTWETGESSGYTCPDGSSLYTCGKGVMCATVNVVPPVPCCFLLTACDGSIVDILVNNDLSAFVDTVIKLCPSNIPSSAGSGTGSGVPIVDSPPVGYFWTLSDCCGVLPAILVENDLSAYIDGIVVIPSLSLTTCWTVNTIPTKTLSSGVIDVTGGTYYVDCNECKLNFPCQTTPTVTLTECKCFTVTRAAGCVGSITLLNESSIPNFGTCDLCKPPCHYLVDCTDANNYILTDDVNIVQHLGQIIKLEGCPNTCWQVLQSDTCTPAKCIPPVVEVFVTCIDCLPPVPVIPPKSLNPRRIKPGYYTAGCSPEYTEKISCSFAEQMYNIMLIKRYGLKICCEIDQIKWEIKKQLLDFKAIYDPELCKCSLASCLPPKCITVEVNVFTPFRCIPPANVTITIGFIPVICSPPSNVLIKIS